MTADWRHTARSGPPAAAELAFEDTSAAEPAVALPALPVAMGVGQDASFATVPPIFNSWKDVMKVMKVQWLLAMTVALTLGGCAAKFQLVSNGSAYVGDYNVGSRDMSVLVDGKQYKGRFVWSAAGAGSTSTAFVNGKPLLVTTGSSSNAARATLLSTRNEVLRCEFVVLAPSINGACQDDSGRQFDMVDAPR